MRRRSAVKSPRRDIRTPGRPGATNISQRDIYDEPGRPARRAGSRRRDVPAVFAKADYVALAGFRTELRRFLRFSELGARAVGMTPQQHQLLLAIAGRPGRDWAAVGELAAALGVRPHTAVGLVDRSARAGLVRREPARDDRRRVEVRLTARGRRALERVSRRNRAELAGMRRALDLALLPREAGSQPRSRPRRAGPPRRGGATVDR